jgi:type IV pilus assembly protein PilC
MPLYTYKAIDANGKSVMGRVDAGNVFDLEQRLARMGLDLVSGAPTAQKSRLIGGSKVPRQDLINFCFHLEQLAGAGVPIVEGLIDLRESTENLRFREVVGGLVETIEGGKSLSQALADYPEVFSKVTTSLVRSGEQTGKLPEVLKGLAETLKWEDELSAQTKKLMLYPAFVGGIVLLVTFFLMIYLVPQMTGFIRNMGPGHSAADAHSDPRLRFRRRLLVAHHLRALRRLVWRQGRSQEQPVGGLCDRPPEAAHSADRPDPAQDHPRRASLPVSR